MVNILTSALGCDITLTNATYKPDKKRVNKRLKLKNSRMRADYEFLKKLELVLQQDEVTEENTCESILRSKDEMEKIVEEAVTFLEEREQFWANIK